MKQYPSGSYFALPFNDGEVRRFRSKASDRERSFRLTGKASSYGRGKTIIKTPSSKNSKSSKHRNKGDVDLKDFCLAATCEDWSLYKQRRKSWESKRSRTKEMNPESMFCSPAAEKRWLMKAVIERSKKVRTPCFLWNPNYRQKISLPDIRGVFRFDKFLLTAPPTPTVAQSSECCVLFFGADLAARKLKLLYYSLGDHNKKTTWSQLDYGGSSASPVLDAITFKGKLYIINRRQVLETEIRGHQLYMKRIYDARIPTNFQFAEVNLVESCGELYAVQRKSILDIDIFRMDFLQERWERVYGVGEDKIMFFIGHYSMMYSAAEVGIIGGSNTVYFTEEDDEQTLYSFSLADKCLSICKNRPSSSIWVLHDEVMSSISLPDEPRCDQIIKAGSHGTRECIEYNTTYEDQSGSMWFQLPLDAQKLISQKLSSAFDCINFRAVCRSWRSLVHPIRWAPNHILGVPRNYPWLMFPQKEKGFYSYSLYDPIANLKHEISIPELEDCRVRFSSQGWLLVTKAQVSIFFFEPFTRTKIQLPDFPDFEEENWIQLDGLCFTNSPTSPYWQIFGIIHCHQEYLGLLYLESGYEGWRFHPLTCKSFPDPSFMNPVFDGQSFCYLGKDGSLLFFQWKDINFNLRCIKASSSSSSYSLSSYWRKFLVHYEDELLLVCLDEMAKMVDVFKLDRKMQEWVPIESLEKKILYVSQTTCLVVDDVEHKKSNTIQFPIFSDVHGNGSNIGYSLKAKKLYHNDHGQVYSSVMDFYDTKEFLSGIWLNPLVVHEMKIII